MSFVECPGDYKVTGRDSLVFLVDASKQMFIKGKDGNGSNFDMTMEVRSPLQSLDRPDKSRCRCEMKYDLGAVHTTQFFRENG